MQTWISTMSSILLEHTQRIIKTTLNSGTLKYLIRLKSKRFATEDTEYTERRKKVIYNCKTSRKLCGTSEKRVPRRCISRRTSSYTERITERCKGRSRPNHNAFR